MRAVIERVLIEADIEVIAVEDVEAVQLIEDQDFDLGESSWRVTRRSADPGHGALPVTVIPTVFAVVSPAADDGLVSISVHDPLPNTGDLARSQIGRASCRERV